ncbi:hypothetical protein BaRGS_00037816 [Batillaria attramentaria]|uniref:Uncharacterized protein n=1 Tax=Batillaria attramentaria TaxID=370345 RepID=A0ABD0J8L2_9CAEN
MIVSQLNAESITNVAAVIHCHRTKRQRHHLTNQAALPPADSYWCGSRACTSSWPEFRDDWRHSQRLGDLFRCTSAGT